MFLKFLTCVFVLELLKGYGVAGKSEWCDWSRSVAPEGILGEQTAAPWLGVLRVHLHEGPTFRIALTGIVMVKQNYAVGNADDIARIPRRTFKEHSRAMFVHTNGSLWFCSLVDYMTHPDYEVDSFNSIALVELDAGQLSQYPIPPICWPPSGYNVSTDTYVLGYTDENEVLQKFIHKVQYVKPDLCTEFYTRAGLLEAPLTPVHVTCAYASTNKEHCVWENGMALVGNATGRWMLLGLSLHGPGCSAPSRFISLTPYFSWIESATNVQGVQALRSEQAQMKTAFNEGFRPKPSIAYVPAHELLRSDIILRASDAGHLKHDLAHYHPGAIAQDDDDFHISRINDTRIDLLWSGGLPDKYGNCGMKGLRQVYRDFVDIKLPEPHTRALVRYKISLFDVEFSNYTCVTIELDVSNTSHAELDYAYNIEEDSVFPQNIQDIIRVYPLYTLSRIIEKTNMSHLAPSPIKSSGKKFSMYHINLYLKVRCIGKCKMDIQFFGPYVGPPTTERTTTSTTEHVTSTTDPYSSPKGSGDSEVLKSNVVIIVGLVVVIFLVKMEFSTL